MKHTLSRFLADYGMVFVLLLRCAFFSAYTRFDNAVDSTARRVGFVVSGDLEVAANMARNEPTVVGGPSQNDKVRDLVLFSVSEDYFAARKDLQLTIV